MFFCTANSVLLYREIACLVPYGGFHDSFLEVLIVFQ